MGIRTVERELEAKLQPLKGGFFSKPSGKLERKWYADNTERLKVLVRKLKVPDGARAMVTVAGESVAELEIQSGSGRVDLESSQVGELPDFEVGQTVEISVGDQVYLSGLLYED